MDRAYGSLMVAECAKYDMKPVCDQSQYCRADKNGLSLDGHYYYGYLSRRDDRNSNSYFPCGFKEVKGRWHGMVNYAGINSCAYVDCSTPADFVPGLPHVCVFDP